MLSAKLFGQRFNPRCRNLVSVTRTIFINKFTTNLDVNSLVRLTFFLINALVICGVVFLVACVLLPFLSTLRFHEQVLASIPNSTQQAINDAHTRIFVRHDIPMTECGATSMLNGHYLSKHFRFIFVSGLLGVSVALWRINNGWTNFGERET